MPKRNTGRPKGSSPLCTPETQKAICDALELSVPDKYAAEANGIDERTLQKWVEKGADGTEPYASFRAAVTRARAKAVLNLTGRALRGEKGSAQATWFLERRYRKEYGPVQRIEHAGPDGGPLQIEAAEHVAQAVRADPKALTEVQRVLGQALSQRERA